MNRLSLIMKTVKVEGSFRLLSHILPVEGTALKVFVIKLVIFLIF